MEREGAAPWSGAEVDDPTPTIELLDQLFDDDSEYVRRSVANHLNDISKGHPALAVATAKRWSKATTHGDYVIRHAPRSLVKRGDPAALAVLGFGNADAIRISGLTCRPTSIAIDPPRPTSNRDSGQRASARRHRSRRETVSR